MQFRQFLGDIRQVFEFIRQNLSNIRQVERFIRQTTIYSSSNTPAAPIPPPIHIVTTPYFLPWRFNS